MYGDMAVVTGITIWALQVIILKAPASRGGVSSGVIISFEIGHFHCCGHTTQSGIRL